MLFTLGLIHLAANRNLEINRLGKQGLMSQRSTHNSSPVPLGPFTLVHSYGPPTAKTRIRPSRLIQRLSFPGRQRRKPCLYALQRPLGHSYMPLYVHHASHMYATICMLYVCYHRPLGHFFSVRQSSLSEDVPEDVFINWLWLVCHEHFADGGG